MKSKVFQPPYTEEFELFWRAYPPRINLDLNVLRKADKQGAWLEWQKLTKDEMIAALNVVRQEKTSKWTPDARKWLLHKRWEDMILPMKPYERPASAEISQMVTKLTTSLGTVPKARLSNYMVNKKRNENLDRLETEPKI